MTVTRRASLFALGLVLVALLFLGPLAVGSLLMPEVIP